MALTPASILADYSSGIGTQGATLKVNTNEKRVGIGTTNPQGTLQVGTAITMGSGIVTATSFDANTASFSGNVSVGGTLTYEDVTNVDSVGIITARSGVHIPNGKIGIGTTDTDLGKAVIYSEGNGNGQGPILSLVRKSDTPATNDKLGTLNFYGKDSSDNTVNYKSVYTRIVDPTSGSATGQLCIGTDTSNSGRQVIIDADGSVGIGTDNITEKLHVVGNARVTGILTVGTASLTLDGTTGKITGGSLTDAQVAALSTSIVGTGTTVDVFVYDTSKDSDGGAWRKRTQHTSWYTDSLLNTSIRGSRKEFPAVAVIVAEASKVTIYDGDDPDLPLWISFPTTNAKAVTALNGELCLACNDDAPAYHALLRINFVADRAYNHRSSTAATVQGVFLNSLSSTDLQLLDDGASYFSGYDASTVPNIANNNVNDVAMTVLPNAPIDDATGLPIPTIAIGTFAGVSVINDDGTIVDITATSYDQTSSISFTQDNELIFSWDNDTRGRFIHVYDIPSSDVSHGGVGYEYGAGKRFYTNYAPSSKDLEIWNNTSLTFDTKDVLSNGIGHTQGLTLLDENPTSPANGMVAYATTSYNTGWMQGDIKGAFLSEKTTGTLSTTDLELIDNGDFSNGTTGWSSDATPIFTVSGGVASVDRNGGSAQGQCYQTITTEVGRTYTVGVQVTALSDGFQVYADEGSTGMSQGAINSTGTHYWSFTATSTSTRLDFSATQNVNGTASFDNITIFDGVADRSVNQKALTVYGTGLTRSVVATGADLVAYSGFSASNYLQQPYNSDLDFGTGDFSVIGWVKKNGNNNKMFIDNRSNGNNCGFSVESNTNGTVRFRTKVVGSGTESLTNTTRTIGDNNWHCVAAVVSSSGTNHKIYVDGVLDVNATVTAYSVSTGSNELYFGIAGGFGSIPLDDGSLALWRVSGSAPSPEQIKKIYEDEKVLFQENAKCTLYGSSDAVTALGYDDDEETLYVGTSSGRSDFRGLRRINNTTTAVTTAISASNGLVAEQ